MTENPFSCSFLFKQCTVHERDINAAVSIKKRSPSAKYFLAETYHAMAFLSRKSASEQSIVKVAGVLLLMDYMPYGEE